MVCSILSRNFSSLYFIRFLTYYAHKANDQPAYDMTRQWHIFGEPMIVISLFVFLSLRIQNSDHFRTAIFNYWWMFAISFIFL